MPDVDGGWIGRELEQAAQQGCGLLPDVDGGLKRHIRVAVIEEPQPGGSLAGAARVCFHGVS